MASRTTLNSKNLEALGASRLAALLLEITADDAAAKRRLRLELAGTAGPKAVSREVRKRLATVARSGALLDRQGLVALVDDLDVQRRAIVERVAEGDPEEALDLLWRLVELAPSVMERSADRSGTVIGFFHDVVGDMGEIAPTAGADPTSLADRTYKALLDNDYGQYDELLRTLAPALGEAGLARLEERMRALSEEAAPRVPERERRVVGRSATGPLYADDIEARARKSAARRALQEIADARGDVDAFVAQWDETARRMPGVAAEIARRLRDAGRPHEALEVLDAVEHRRRGWPDFAWEDARIEVLDALGRDEEAQAARWSCFERALSAPHLRAHLQRLADFDDVVAEKRALEHARTYPSLLQALAFLVAWPALDKAATLVVERAGELDGDHYTILTSAADALHARYPLAATLLLRAMIDFALTEARSSRYGHAARHLTTCATLAASIEDFGAFDPHEAYVAGLRARHGRKTAFWSKVRETG